MSITYGILAPKTLGTAEVRVDVGTGEAVIVRASIDADAWVGRRFPSLGEALAATGEESPGDVQPAAFEGLSEHDAIAYELRRLGATVECLSDGYHLIVNGRRVSTCGRSLFRAWEMMST